MIFTIFFSAFIYSLDVLTLFVWLFIFNNTEFKNVWLSPGIEPKTAGGLACFIISFVLQIRISQCSEDDDNSAWLTGSKSCDELNEANEEEVDPRRVVDREKNSRTSKLIKRIFKRKTMTPGSMKQSKLGGGSTMMVHRSSKTSNDDVFMDREGALMASISMPDIASEWRAFLLNVLT